MKVMFLDHDGVICLSKEWGSRYKKTQDFKNGTSIREIPIKYRFDDFNKKAVETINYILNITNAEIVVVSDWRNFSSLAEMKEYYILQGISKEPLDYTPFISQCKVPEDFHWDSHYDLEQVRALEIKEWLSVNTNVEKWVAIDDLNMGFCNKELMKHPWSSVEDYTKQSWRLNNFIHVSTKTGINKKGVSDDIISFLK